MLPAALKAAQERLGRGERVAFGPVVIAPDGVEISTDLIVGGPMTRHVRWSDVRSISVHNGALLVYPRKAPHPNCEFLPVMLGNIPNAPVAVQMVGALAGHSET